MTRPWGLPMRHKNSRTTQTFRLCRPGICICGNFRTKNGDSETRTRDLYVANVSLSQLSYIPIQIIISLSIEYARFKILQIQKNFSFFSLHSRWGYAIIIFVVGVWRSLVARSAGGREVAGSNPVTPIFILSFLKKTAAPVPCSSLFSSILFSRHRPTIHPARTVPFSSAE